MSNAHKISLLDCTLRDGGYINDWRFGNLTIRSVISRLDSAGIDYIEIGFLNERVSYDNERSIFPDIPSMEKTLGKLRTKNAKLIGMIDFGTFNDKLLIDRSDAVISGIRLIFTKNKADAALQYATAIKEKGYDVFLNLVATSAYSETELRVLAGKINLLSPFGVSIVDTYGLMFNTDMEKYVRILDEALLPSITLGYHSHNNLQMSNANTVEFLKMELNHNRIADATVLGMGKNAGNACLELIADYMDKSSIKKLDIVQILECAYADIQKFQADSNWGYRLDYLVSAILDCTPNWTKQYMKKNTLSIKDVYTILSSLTDEQKFLPTAAFPEISDKLYIEYMSKHVDDKESLLEIKNLLMKRKVLLLFPGKSLKDSKILIDEFIETERPVVITVNFISDLYASNYAIITNSLRYSQMSGVCADLTDLPQIWVTSNVVCSNLMPPKYIFNFKTLYELVGGAASSALVLQLLFSVGINKVAIAGLDGFTDHGGSYFDSGYNLSFKHYSNDELKKQLNAVKANFKEKQINFITPSQFREIFA